MKYEIIFEGNPTGIIKDKKEASLQELRKALKRHISEFDFISGVEYREVK